MKIAITGGIGSGKTHVCALLEKYGIKVYDCDSAAKRLMRSSPELQQALTDTVGMNVFPNGILDKAMLSKFIVSSDENARKIDEVVHPAVACDFINSGCDWIESAILFESGFDKRIKPDYVVCVTAPMNIRLERIMRRDNLTHAKAMEWINRQMGQEEKLAKSDFEILNDGEADLESQIKEIFRQINNKS